MLPLQRAALITANSAVLWLTPADIEAWLRRLRTELAVPPGRLRGEMLWQMALSGHMS